MQSSVIRKVLVLVGIASLSVALGAGSAAAGPKGKAYGKVAAKTCAKEMKAVGKQAFTETYGKPAMPRCIGVTKPEVKQATKSASKDCRAERNEIGVEAFNGKYGSNKNKKNAFGKCVSRGVKQEMNGEVQEFRNAAKECKAERSDPAFADSHEGKTFDEFYGTNKNLKNAYGKCVSSKVRENDEQV